MDNKNLVLMAAKACDEKKANKLKSKSIIVIGDDEAVKGEFIIRLFDQSGNEIEEEVISFENDIELEKWIKNNLHAK